MSRSYRKTPICGITCKESDKWWKVNASRVWRKAVRAALRDGRDPPQQREIRNPWWWPKDGKHRFDSDEWREGMRK